MDVWHTHRVEHDINRTKIGCMAHKKSSFEASRKIPPNASDNTASLAQ